MYSVLARLRQAAQEGMTDTQGEFGVLLSISPLSVKLDEDPTPLEAYEMEVLRSANLRVEDIGRKVALMRCTNGQYLLCGVVE